MIIVESQLRKIIREELQVVRERYGFGDKVQTFFGLQKDFNYEAPEMPFGGRTRNGNDFIAIQIPSTKGTFLGGGKLSRRDEGGYLVLLDTGEEAELSAEEIMPGAELAAAVPGAAREDSKDEITPYLSRNYGATVKRQLEDADII